MPWPASIAEWATATTVGDIVQRARTSRRTFYDHFADREACLVALLTVINRQTIRDLSRRGCHRALEVQIRQAVESWVAFAESHAPVMLIWIRESPAFGPAVREVETRRDRGVHQADQGSAIRSVCGQQDIKPIPRHRAVMFIGDAGNGRIGSGGRCGHGDLARSPLRR